MQHKLKRSLHNRTSFFFFFFFSSFGSKPCNARCVLARQVRMFDTSSPDDDDDVVVELAAEFVWPAQIEGITIRGFSGLQRGPLAFAGAAASMGVKCAVQGEIFRIESHRQRDHDLRSSGCFLCFPIFPPGRKCLSSSHCSLNNGELPQWFCSVAPPANTVYPPPQRVGNQRSNRVLRHPPTRSDIGQIQHVCITVLTRVNGTGVPRLWHGSKK